MRKVQNHKAFIEKNSTDLFGNLILKHSFHFLPMKFHQPIQLKVQPSGRKGKSKRIVCLSDTDKMKIKTLIENKVIPDGDIFIHCGDLSNCGTIEELEGEKNS
jgi:hypothetical protein